MSDGRCRGRGFEHDRIAEGERGRALPRRDRDREVPGRNQPEHADRLTVGLRVDSGPRRLERLSVPAKRFAREIFADARRAHDLAGALGQRLAFFARQQGAELLGARHDQRTRFVEHVGADLGRTLGPCWKCGPSRFDRLVHLGLSGLRIARHDVVEVGRVEAFAGRVAADRLSVDEMVEGVQHQAFSKAPAINPRSARLRISARVPNVHAGASRDVVTVLKSVPSLGVEISTSSPTLWVKPRPSSSRS